MSLYDDAEYLIQPFGEGENEFSLWDQKNSDPLFLTYTFLDFYPDYYKTSFFDLSSDKIDITDDFTANPLTLTFTLNQIAAVNAMLEEDGEDFRASFSDVSNILFGQLFQDGGGIDQSGDITFSRATLISENNEFAFEYSKDNTLGTTDKSGIVVDEQNEVLLSALEHGQQGAWVLMHEIGHSLGLADIKNTNLYNTAVDSQKYTMMSYNDFVGLHATGLQLLDIAAIQEKYGRNYTTRNEELDGNFSTVGTEYSKDNVLYNANSPNGSVLYTIWDGGGNDTIDASGFTERVQIDLRQGNFSSIGLYLSGSPVLFDNLGGETGGENPNTGVEIPDNNDHGNIAIAFHTVIENAIGTDDVLGDILIGNAWSNRLEGRGGNDWLYGDGVVYDGKTGFMDTDPDDPFDPNQTVPLDIYQDDILIGGLGNDHLFAGGGLFDGAFFEGEANGVTLTAQGGGVGAVSDTGGQIDEFQGIEWINVGAFNLANTVDYRTFTGSLTVREGTESDRDYAGNKFGDAVIYQFRVDENTIGGSANAYYDNFGTFIGSNQSDTFHLATGMERHYHGAGGMDRFEIVPLAGSVDVLYIDGGDGVDTAFFEGYLQDYTPTVSTAGDVIFMRHNTTGAEISLNGIEKIDFSLTPQVAYAGVTFSNFSSGVFNETRYGSPLYNSVLSKYPSFTADSVISHENFSGHVRADLHSASISMEINKPLEGAIRDRLIFSNPDADNLTATQFTIRIETVIAGDSALGQSAFIPISNPGSRIADIDFYLQISKAFLSSPIFNIGSSGGFLDMGGSGSGDINVFETTYQFFGPQAQVDFGFALVGNTHPLVLGESFFMMFGTVMANVSVINLTEGATYTSSSTVFDKTDEISPFDIVGTAGDDEMTGLAGNDVLSGLGGDDVLFAGFGNDILTGGAGNDDLSGGAGDDVFVFAAGDGFDVIQEDGGTDILHIEGNISLDNLTFTQIGDDLKIDIASGVTIIGQFSGDPAKVVEWVRFSDGAIFQLPNPFMSANQPPIAVGEQFVIDEDGIHIGNLLLNDSDPDGDMIHVQPFTLISAQGSVIAVSGNGDFTYTPAENFYGVESFDYTIEDGNGGSDTATLSMTVNPVNDAPEARDDVFTAYEDTEIEGNLLADTGFGVDFDLDGDTLKVVQNMIASAAGGSVILMHNGDFVYMPPANFHGIDSFEYTVTDGNGGTATATATLTIIPVNDAPEAQDDSFTTGLLTSLTGNVLDDNGSGTDNDPDGDPLTVKPEILFTDQGGMVSLNEDGTFVYTPSTGFNGIDSFHYALLDGQGGETTGTVTVSVVTENGIITGSDFKNVINGRDGDDTIFGRGENDVLHGNNGDDLVIGGAGRDDLKGNHGDDTLIGDDVRFTPDGINTTGLSGDRDELDGGNGNDVLIGGAGSDVLTGGNGADVFKYVSGDNGLDTIKDFKASQGDKIDIAEVLEDYDPVSDILSQFVQVTQHGKNAILSVDADGGGDNFVAFAMVENASNLNLQVLVNNGNLVV